eukprot:gene7438-708_t
MTTTTNGRFFCGGGDGVVLSVSLGLIPASTVGAALLLEESRGHHNDTTTHIGIDAVGDYSDNNADGAVWGSEASNTALGIALTFAGTIVSSVQWIVEEKFLKAKSFSPLQQVGIEGWVEVFLFFAAVLPLAAHAIPGADNGHLEDVSEAFHMIKDSQVLQMLSLGLVASLFLHICCIDFHNSSPNNYKNIMGAVASIAVQTTAGFLATLVFGACCSNYPAKRPVISPELLRGLVALTMSVLAPLLFAVTLAEGMSSTLLEDMGVIMIWSTCNILLCAIIGFCVMKAVGIPDNFRNEFVIGCAFQNSCAAPTAAAAAANTDDTGEPSSSLSVSSDADPNTTTTASDL